MNRRQFVQIISALTAAAAVPMISTAATMPALQPDPNARYRVAMQLFDRCVAYAQDYQESNKRFDQLLCYIKEHFPSPTEDHTTSEAVRKIMYNEYTIAELRSVPPVVADTVYAVALAKLALCHYNIAITPGKLANFDWFHTTYGKFIVDASLSGRLNKSQVMT